MANERTGNYPAAVKAYDRGLAVEPDNVELLNAKGFALFQQGMSEQAVVPLQKAIDVDPRHWKSHNNMALASLDLGELEVAEAHYRESLAIEPQAAIYNDLGFVLARQGLPHEAAEMYRKSLQLAPGSATVHYNLAASLAGSGELMEAEAHFKSSIQIEPTSRAYTALGLILSQQQGRSGESIASLRKAIELDPDNEEARRLLAQTVSP
jgi:Flp pilus assembly protein TadD